MRPRRELYRFPHTERPGAHQGRGALQRRRVAKAFGGVFRERDKGERVVISARLDRASRSQGVRQGDDGGALRTGGRLAERALPAAGEARSVCNSGAGHIIDRRMPRAGTSRGGPPRKSVLDALRRGGDANFQREKESPLSY